MLLVPNETGDEYVMMGLTVALYKSVVHSCLRGVFQQGVTITIIIYIKKIVVTWPAVTEPCVVNRKICHW